MKKITPALTSAAVLAVFTLATASHRREPGYTYVEELANPGFESGAVSPWDNSQGYYYNGDESGSIALGYVSTAHHSGKYGLDMNVGEGSYNCFYESVLTQTLATPVLGSYISSASVWAVAGYQRLYVTISYSDGTGSDGNYIFDAYNAPHGNQGWINWNFTSLINKSKVITAITFWADSGEGDDIVIDDADLTAAFPKFHNP